MTTTTIARVVGRYDIPLPPGPPPARGAWFLDYVLREPKQAGRHLTACWLTLQSLVGPTYRSVWHPFGGIGAGALMADDLFHPDTQVVGEINPDAVDHLQHVLPDRIQVRLADAYDPEEAVPADLVVADFGDLTVWQARHDRKAGPLLDRIFGARPRAVVLTDVAARYLHLQRARYETLLGPGRAADYPTYLAAFAAQLESRYGYQAWSGRYDLWSAVGAFVRPDITGDLSSSLHTFQPTANVDFPVGLELV